MPENFVSIILEKEQQYCNNKGAGERDPEELNKELTDPYNEASLNR